MNYLLAQRSRLLEVQQKKRAPKRRRMISKKPPMSLTVVISLLYSLFIFRILLPELI